MRLDILRAQIVRDIEDCAVTGDLKVARRQFDGMRVIRQLECAATVRRTKADSDEAVTSGLVD